MRHEGFGLVRAFIEESDPCAAKADELLTSDF